MCCGQHGNTPLHLAVKQNYLDVAQALVAAGANLNAENDVWNTPLYYAKNKNYPILVLFLENAGGH